MTRACAEQGAVFGGRSSAILGPTRQAGQLSGRGVTVASQSRREPAGERTSMRANRRNAAKDRARRRKVDVRQERRIEDQLEVLRSRMELRWACTADLRAVVVLSGRGSMVAAIPICGPPSRR